MKTAEYICEKDDTFTAECNGNIPAFTKRCPKCGAPCKQAAVTDAPVN